MDFKSVDRKQYVRGMFDGIAHRYDLMNRLMTGGLDQRWRRRVVQMANPRPGRRMLDLATGTGDLARALLDAGGDSIRVIGLDFSVDMIRAGAGKFQQAQSDGRHRVVIGDIESMGFGENQFDAVTIGFGVRNLGNIPQGLAEMYRVLAPGGRLVILEAVTPKYAWLARCIRLYTDLLLPRLGRLISGDAHAYQYLPWSVEHFPSRGDVLDLLGNIGFTGQRYDDCLLGVATIFSATKPLSSGPVS
jgi:demethylmenaquinone methyltransferase / 2-methoxy-6-polyprenyl-1,4-benzoquinol methylase